jgi:hypothetical protein
MSRKRATAPAVPSPTAFFRHLVWLDGRPLLEVIEPYRRRILQSALYSFDASGRPRFNMVLTGRAKKNWKSADLILAAFYRFLVWRSAAGNDCFLLANDEGQAADDLKLAKKLVAANPVLDREVEVKQKSIERRDGRGVMEILPARDVLGAHGKTFLFVGFDEIHGYRNWELFEALAPDPTRLDALTWITSYDTLWHAPGVPLYDLKRTALAGDDPRLFFSWYSADLCTDLAFGKLEGERRANPSMSSWPDGAGYIEQQRKRLPSTKFRRLHLNLPGAPEGAFFDPASVLSCIVSGRRRLPPQQGTRYAGFVDMSGGSSDDATLGIAHKGPDGRIVLDLVINQGPPPPFNPRAAVKRFAGVLREYGLSRVTGDRYAGETFRADFAEHEIAYQVCRVPKSDLYEALEPKVNAGEVELLDVARAQEQLLTLIVRGSKVDHAPGDHDDWSNALAGAVWAAEGRAGLPAEARVGDLAAVGVPLVATGFDTPWGAGQFHELYPL